MRRTPPTTHRRAPLLRAALVTVVVLGLLAGSMVALADSHEHEVTVIVVDQSDDAPIEDASVDIGDASGTTDAQGAVTLTVSSGAHTIEVTHDDYARTTESITVDEDQTVTVAVISSEELAELREQVEALRDTVSALEEERDQLQEERDELEEQRDSLQRERDDLQDELEETDQQIADMQEQLDQIENNENLPGFGPVVALVAVIVAGIFLVRRR